MGDIDVHIRITLRLVYTQMECGLIQLAQEKVKWMVLVNTIRILQIP